MIKRYAMINKMTLLLLMVVMIVYMVMFMTLIMTKNSENLGETSRKKSENRRTAKWAAF
jgi:heme/copper-type cytochrome/quinol oxidase subunit 2